MTLLPLWVYPMSNLYASLIDDMGEEQAIQTVDMTLRNSGATDISIGDLVKALDEARTRQYVVPTAQMLSVADLICIDKNILKLMCSKHEATDSISALNFGLVVSADFDGPIVHCTSSVYGRLTDEQKRQVKRITVMDHTFDPTSASHVKEWNLLRLDFVDLKKWRGARTLIVNDEEMGTDSYQPVETETLITNMFFASGASPKVRNLKVNCLSISSFRRLGTVELLDCDSLSIHDIEMTNIHDFKRSLDEWYKQFREVRVNKVTVSDFLVNSTTPFGTMLGGYRSFLRGAMCTRSDGTINFVTEDPELACDSVRFVDNIDLIANENWNTISVSLEKLPWGIDTIRDPLSADILFC